MAFSPLQNEQGYGLSTNTATGGIIKTTSGNVQGIIVNSHTNGTIVLCDGVVPTATHITGTLTYASGSQVIPLHGIKFTDGLFANIDGTTQNITIVYN